MFFIITFWKKKIWMLLSLLILFCLLTAGLLAAQAEEEDKTVMFSIDKTTYMQGAKEVKTDVAPYIKNERTMVPVAFVAPALGTEPAQWLPNDRMVMIKKDDKRIYIKIDNKELLINGQKMIMDVAAEIKDLGNGGGRTMLPISFIARALDVGYEWDGVSRSVYFYGYNKVYDQAGSFGPEAGNDVIKGNVIIEADGVKLQNMNIMGNLIVAEKVGQGTVTLENINVKGETFIRGGGKESIHIVGGNYRNITIQDVDGHVRVTATGVDNLPIVIAEGARGDEIILEGNFDSVKVEAQAAKISVQGQSVIGQIDVASQAQDTVLDLTPTATVTKLVLEAKTQVTGTGTVKEAEVNVDGITFAKAPEKQTVAPNVTTQPTTTTNTSSSGGGGGSGGSDSSSSSINVSAVSIQPTTMTLTAGGETGTLTATVTPANATNKNLSWTSSAEGVATVDNGVVTSVAAGTAVITVITEDGNYTATCNVTVVPSSVTEIAVKSGSESVVTALDNNAVTLTAAYGTEVDGLLAAIKSTDGSIQTYAVYHADHTVKESGALVTHDKLIVMAADGNTTAVYAITVETAPNQDQDAPTGLSGTAPSRFEESDGKITGMDNTMEYKLSTDAEWTPVTGTEITGLSAGTYNVRYRAKTGYNAGTAVEVIVPEGAKSSDVSLSVFTIGGMDARGLEGSVIGFPPDGNYDGAYLYVDSFTDFHGIVVETNDPKAVINKVFKNNIEVEDIVTVSISENDRILVWVIAENGFEEIYSVYAVAVPTYTIELSAADPTDLGTVTVGYASQTPTTVTVTRIGTGDITSLAAALSGANPGSFTITQPVVTTLDDETTSTTFTVVPKDGLTVGTYTADVDVTADNGVSETFAVNFEVVNSNPVAHNDTGTLAEDSSIVIDVLANDTDVDADTLSITEFTQGTNGTVEQEGDSLKYTPAADYNGADSFTYEISDDNGGTATATVNVTVNPVNDAPVALNDAVAVNEDSTVLVDVLVNDTDVEGDTLSITGFTQGTNGTVVQEGDSLRYTPEANYNGTDSFTYEISDYNGGTATATVNVTVNPVNDLPVAVNDEAEVDANDFIVIDVLANDTDIDGDDLIVSGVIQGAHGGTTTVDNHTKIKYTPNAGYYGTDSFMYEISDGNGGITTATVSVTVVYIPVTGVSLVVPNHEGMIYVERGQTLQLEATVQPVNATNQLVIWSANPDHYNTATIDENGLVTAHLDGSTTITVTTDDNSFTDSVNLGVRLTPTSVSINEGDQTVVVDGTVQLTATVLPNDASDTSVVWFSDNEIIAEVNLATGEVTGKSIGETTIRVLTALGNLEDTVQIIVE